MVSSTCLIMSKNVGKKNNGIINKCPVCFQVGKKENAANSTITRDDSQKKKKELLKYNNNNHRNHSFQQL